MKKRLITTASSEYPVCLGQTGVKRRPRKAGLSGAGVRSQTERETQSTHDRWKGFIFAFLIFLAAVNITNNVPISKGQVLGATTFDYDADIAEHETKVATVTAFDQKEVVGYENIFYDTVYEDNPEMEYGQEKVVRAGVNGTKTLTYLLTYWIDDIIDKQLIQTEVDSSVNEIVAKGTKIVWRTIDTPEHGEIKYWHKMQVWATKYDSTCLGCNNTTAIGAHLQKGVCATDPKVIPLWTSFYVPGYGQCAALDVGGAIKGNKIDLAYENAAEASWGAGWKDIYLINNSEKMTSL